jgi:hypothetical protein
MTELHPLVAVSVLDYVTGVLFIIVALAIVVGILWALVKGVVAIMRLTLRLARRARSR